MVEGRQSDLVEKNGRVFEKKAGEPDSVEMNGGVSENKAGESEVKDVAVPKVSPDDLFGKEMPFATIQPAVLYYISCDTKFDQLEGVAWLGSYCYDRHYNLIFFGMDSGSAQSVPEAKLLGVRSALKMAVEHNIQKLQILTNSKEVTCRIKALQYPTLIAKLEEELASIKKVALGCEPEPEKHLTREIVELSSRMKTFNVDYARWEVVAFGKCAAEISMKSGRVQEEIDVTDCSKKASYYHCMKIIKGSFTDDEYCKLITNFCDSLDKFRESLKFITKCSACEDSEEATEKEIGDDGVSEGKKEEVGTLKVRKNIEGESDELQQISNKKLISFHNPEELTREDYDLSCLTKESDIYLAVRQFSVDGHQKIVVSLCVPKRSHLDHCDTQQKQPGIKLLVHGVSFSVEELIPEFLWFVEGIVATDDAPADNKIDAIRLELVNNCFEMFFQLAKSKDDYRCFYEAFSKELKLGFKDSQNIAKLADLLRYYSTKSGVEMTSLKDYVTRMEEGQKCIYYIAGRSKAAVEKSPLLESLRKKGYEVLFMVDAGDEVVLEQLRDYDGKKLVSAGREGSKFEEETHGVETSSSDDGVVEQLEYDGKRIVSATREGLMFEEETDELKKKREEKMGSIENLCKTFEHALGDKVEKVVVSDTIKGYPCCVVTGKETSTANKDTKKHVTSSINPDDALMENIKTKAEILKELMELVFEGAVLSRDADVKDPTAYWDFIYRMMKDA